MTIKEAIDALIKPFSTVNWHAVNGKDYAKGPIGYYSHNYVFPQPNPIQLFGHPVRKLFAYVENGTLLAFYMAFEFERDILHRISADLGSKPTEVSEAFGNGDQDFVPFKWYWEYRGFSIAVHKMPGSTSIKLEAERKFDLIIISKYSLENYTLK